MKCSVGRGINLKKILEFLASEGAFLYEEHNCHIVDSKYVATFGGTGSVTLRNGVVEIRFWLDRDLLFMDMRAVGRKFLYSWYSMDILRQLLTGEVRGTELMDRENVEFLKANFEKFQDLFSKSNLATTEAACKKLEKQRSKRMFG